MIKINVQHNFPKVQRQLNQLHVAIRDKALAAAINKTVDKARTEMVRSITQEFNIKAQDVRPRIAVRSAKAKALTVAAVLEALPGRGASRAMNVIHFLERSVSLAEARRRRKTGTLNQLRFKFKRKGPTKMIDGSFIVTANRGTFVARRITGKQAENRPGRLTKHTQAIEAVSIIDVPQMFNTQRISQRVQDRIRREFPIEFDRSARHFAEKFGRG